MAAGRRDYLGRVQVLRFFAAAAVLFAHLQHEILTRFPDEIAFKPFLLIDGGVGVDIFFVISGFIMYHVSYKRFGEQGAVRQFLVRRFFRVAPLYYFATLLMLTATVMFSKAVSISQPSFGAIAASFLFFPMTNSLDQTAPVLKLGWTLNFEAYFYVVFALALALNRRMGLIVMTLVLSVIVGLAQLLSSPPVPIAFWGQSLAFEFLSGVGVAILYNRGLRLNASVALMIITAGVLLLAGMRLTDLTALAPRAVYAGVPAWLIVMAVVCAPFDRRQGRLKRFFVAGGEASFALYIIHPFGIRAGALLWARLSLPPSPWLYITLLIIVVIMAAFAVNLLIERPLDRIIRRWLDGPPKQSSATAVAST